MATSAANTTLSEHLPRFNFYGKRIIKRYKLRPSQIGYYYGLPELCEQTSDGEDEECYKDFDPYSNSIPELTFGTEKELSFNQFPLSESTILQDTFSGKESLPKSPYIQGNEKATAIPDNEKTTANVTDAATSFHHLTLDRQKDSKDFDPYSNTVPELTFNTERDLTLFHQFQASECTLQETYSESTDIQGNEKATATVSDAATSPHHPKFDRHKAISGLQISFQQQKDTRRISVFGGKRPFGIARKSLSQSLVVEKERNKESLPVKKVTSMTACKPLRPTHEQISKLVLKRPSNDALRKIIDYESPQTFPSPPKHSTALRIIRDYKTPNAAEKKNMVKNRSVLNNVETTPKSTKNAKDLRDESKENDSVKLASQFTHKLHFYDSEDETIYTNDIGDTIDSTLNKDDEENVREEKDGDQSQFIGSSFGGDFYPEDVDEQDYEQPGPSTKVKDMARLLNESIVSCNVATPEARKTPMPTKTSRLKWTDITPKTVVQRLINTPANSSITNSPNVTDSPPVKHIVFGKGKSPDYVLAKPKIRTYEPVEQDIQNNVRRSNRNRVRTLRSWLNEKAVYRVDNEGNQTLVDVETVEVKDKRSKKFLSTDPVLQFDRERAHRAHRKRHKEIKKEKTFGNSLSG